MKKLLIAVMLFVMMLAAPLAYAEVDTRGLTKAQQAELTLKAEEMKRTIPVPPVPTASNIETATKWAEAGKSLAVGLGAGAREIGVAVNDFADTRVGRITTYIIIWKLLGKEILGLSMALLLIFVLIPVVWKCIKTVINEVVEYEDSTFLGIPMRRKKSVRLNFQTDGDTATFIFGCAIMIGLFVFAINMLPF